MDIAAHIGQLVMEHECVIIPGLGGFITDYRAAEINQLQHQILPPSRKLVFNAQINGNDGLLANFLSQRLDISYKTALLLLEVFANYCQRDLAEGKQINFGDLGILDKNIHNKLEFYPNNAINYNEDSFGLKALDFQKIERKSDFSLRAPIIKREVRPNSTNIIQLNSSVIRKIAALLIPFGLLIGAVFYLPSIGQNKYLQQTSFFSFLNNFNQSETLDTNLDNSKTESTTEEFTDISNIESKSTLVETAVSENIENKSDITTPVLSDLIVRDRIVDLPKGKFHIICGSFGEKSRADALVAHLKSEGFAAFAAGQSKSGTYRVSIQSFANLNDASRQMQWVRAQGFDRAWILNKRF